MTRYGSVDSTDYTEDAEENIARHGSLHSEIVELSSGMHLGTLFGAPHFGDSASSLDDISVDRTELQFVETFRWAAASFEDYAWDEWVEAYAAFSARRETTSHGVRRASDFLMDAHRQLAYLLADYMFVQCRERIATGPCPFERLSSKRSRFLVSLSLLEFLRKKAYFIFQERADKSPGKEHNDYFQAVNEVRGALFGCRCHAVRDRDARIDLAKGFAYSHPLLDAETIAAAKKNALRRLGEDASLNDVVDKFVEDFYNRRLARYWMTASSRDDSIVDFAFRVPGVVNIYELIVAHMLERGTDEQPQPDSNSALAELIMVFGTKALTKLIAAGGELGTKPAPRLLARIKMLSEMIEILRDAYDDEGIRRWFERPRTQLGGKPPSALLVGDWEPTDKGPARARKLATNLKSMVTT